MQALLPWTLVGMSWGLMGCGADHPPKKPDAETVALAPSEVEQPKPVEQVVQAPPQAAEPVEPQKPKEAPEVKKELSEKERIDRLVELVSKELKDGEAKVSIDRHTSYMALSEFIHGMFDLRAGRDEQAVKHFERADSLRNTIRAPVDHYTLMLSLAESRTKKDSTWFTGTINNYRKSLTYGGFLDSCGSSFDLVDIENDLLIWMIALEKGGEEPAKILYSRGQTGWLRAIANLRQPALSGNCREISNFLVGYGEKALDDLQRERKKVGDYTDTLTKLGVIYAVDGGTAAMVKRFREPKIQVSLTIDALDYIIKRVQVQAPAVQDGDKKKVQLNLPPKEIVAAWRKAGAEVDWPGFDDDFSLPPASKPPVFGRGPFFRFRNWQEGVYATLPQPEQVFTLDLSESNVTDSGLKHLAGLNNLQTLDLRYTKVTGEGLKDLASVKNLQTLKLSGSATDAGLKHLAELKGLQTLDLASSKVTGEGLKELAGLKNLQTLDLTGAPVTDAGMKDLAGLKSLQTLNLAFTKVTDAGLKDLATGLTSLQTLNLAFTKVTDAGLKDLAGLKSLQLLSLNDTKVKDAGMKELASFENLQFLFLNSTQMTDEGLKELTKLKSLRRLDLVGTGVTNAGVAELQKALPKCFISR